MNFRENILAWTQPPFPRDIQKSANQALQDWDSGKQNELTEAFSIPLEFGTGGIRGVLGMGIGRLNRYTVGRAAFGFSQYLIKKNPKAKIVIAYDSRRMSKEFCEITAGIAANLGLTVYYFDSVAPTPLLSYAVRYYKADGGVVITASHNPAEYNGFKAYLSDGGQLVPPDDKKIIQKIESISNWNSLPFLEKQTALYKKKVKPVESKCFESYLKQIKKSGILNSSIPARTRSSLKIVYSPLHGTGGKYMKSVLNSVGYKNVFLVPEQKDPDGNFPTVALPNPEEPEALALCEKWAKEKSAEVFIATDPDADRLGIGVRNRDGKYTLLNGNQIGSIMAAYLCEKVAATKNPRKIRYHLVKTIVTTDLQERIAKANKIKIANVLTGFKYIAMVMKKLESKPQDKFLFGGEESYGYLPVDFVRDKDSLSSAVLLLEILAEKKDLLGYLDEIYLKYGLFLEGLKSLTLPGAAGKEKIARSLDSLRKENWIGRKIGNREVVSFIDYKEMLVKDRAGVKPLKGYPSSNVIQLELTGNAKLTIRPSGTEPKVKIYSSYGSLIQPKSAQDIPNLMNSLEKEIKVAEAEFSKLAGLA
jgi:phosphoglucomutase/phosphomannomutase